MKESFSKIQIAVFFSSLFCEMENLSNENFSQEFQNKMMVLLQSIESVDMKSKELQVIYESNFLVVKSGKEKTLL